MSDSLSFKKFHAFVSLETEPTDSQITEIFGIFKNNAKLDDLKKKRAELTDKQKLDARKKDALFTKRKKELDDNGGFDPKERGSLTMRSQSATGRSAERDWIANLANEGTDGGAQYAGYGAMLVKYGFKRQKAAGTYRNEDDTSCGTIRISKEGHWTHSSAEGDFEGTTAQTLERHLDKICKETVTLDAETIIREGARDLLDGSMSAEEIIATLFQALDDEQKEELKTLAFSEAVAIAEVLKLREAKLGVDLDAMCATLKKHRTIDSAEVYTPDDAIDVFTKKGDVVRFKLNKTKGQFYASVQGQKHDIDIGDIGETTTDMLEFMAGLSKNWYREYDDHFDD